VRIALLTGNALLVAGTWGRGVGYCSVAIVPNVAITTATATMALLAHLGAA